MSASSLPLRPSSPSPSTLDEGRGDTVPCAPPPPSSPHPFPAPSRWCGTVDTIPTPLRGILKSGFCGVTEFGNHGYYQFQGVGDDDDAPMPHGAAFEAGDLTVVALEPRALRNLLQGRRDGRSAR